jgi:hypothetical protein
MLNYDDGVLRRTGLPAFEESCGGGCMACDEFVCAFVLFSNREFIPTGAGGVHRPPIIIRTTNQPHFASCCLVTTRNNNIGKKQMNEKTRGAPPTHHTQKGKAGGHDNE